MPYKKLLPRFWEDLQKLTVNSLAPGLFAESLSLSLAVVVAVAGVPATLEPANASTVTSWQFDPTTNQLEITLPEGTTPTYSVLNPSQIAVNLPNTEIGVDATQLYPQGTVRSVGVSQLQPGTARILVNLAPGAFRPGQVQFQRIGVENRWVLRPSIEPTRSMKTPETQPQPAIQVPQNQSPTDPNSTAATKIDRPEPPTSLNPGTNSSQPPTPNDEIRPITVPLVNLRLEERRGVQAAAVPRLTPQITAAAAPQQRTLTFGEPLPRGRSNAALQAEAGANVLLPAGTEISLLYPGTEALRLARAKPRREEVLLLQGGIFDSRGNTIVPANTPVIGRFETTNLGSQFVVEAISLNGRNIPLFARSQPVAGRRQQPSDRSVLRNTGIGGLALFLLSGFSGIGLLAGATAGAATTYVAAPQPATIQPGQILQVQLTEDLPQFGF